MEWVTTFSKAINFIEKNIMEDITLADVAAEVYISPLYLGKGFQIMTGYTLSEYIRCRRLYLAAKDIRETDIKIIDAALRYGYDTPESFTKAFTRFHGCSPVAMRKKQLPAKLFLPLKITVSVQGGNKMDYRIETKQAFKVIGFERVFENETAYAEIPKFWEEVFAKYMPCFTGKPAETPAQKAVVSNKIGEFGICIDDIGGNRFRYIIGGRYMGGDVPEGMTVCEIPEYTWAVFNHIGALPESFQDLNTEIFRDWLPNNPDYQLDGNIDIEWYSGEGKTTDPDYKSAIWVPVKKC